MLDEVKFSLEGRKACTFTRQLKLYDDAIKIISHCDSLASRVGYVHLW